MHCTAKPVQPHRHACIVRQFDTCAESSARPGQATFPFVPLECASAMHGHADQGKVRAACHPPLHPPAAAMALSLQHQRVAKAASNPGSEGALSAYSHASADTEAQCPADPGRPLHEPPRWRICFAARAAARRRRMIMHDKAMHAM